MIKESFQFLNAFSLSLKNMFMFPIWKSNQILRPIIISNPIQMMNYPPLRHRLTMILLPYKDMLFNIPLFRSTGVLRIPNKYISKTDEATPSPLGMLSPPERMHNSLFPFMFSGTTITTLGFLQYNHTAISAKICGVLYSHNFILTQCNLYCRLIKPDE
ncbi:hypothetical protein LCGC14_0406340 [marine sediment metagenome]|uniref:Uncharacterized protein n=1 Tax=marine sediment metagenome TaxID=412755 RepID=A0A0F9SVD0_9ZZZZ